MVHQPSHVRWDERCGDLIRLEGNRHDPFDPRLLRPKYDTDYKTACPPEKKNERKVSILEEKKNTQKLR